MTTVPECLSKAAEFESRAAHATNWQLKATFKDLARFHRQLAKHMEETDELSAMELADKFLDLWQEAHSKNEHDHEWLKMMYRRYPIDRADAVREALAARRTARGWPDQVEEIIMMLWVPYEKRKD